MSADKPITDLINGQITAAKKGAKRYNYSQLLEAGIEVLGLSRRLASLHAGYLKGRCTWEQYCEGTAPAVPEPHYEADPKALAEYLAERRAKGLAQEAKDESARCDPAAVYCIAASLDAFGDKSENMAGNVSTAYNGGDQFYREIMRVGDAFERWACLHVDFATNAEVWPYYLRDRFADALEAHKPGAILTLDKLTPADFAGIAKKLKLTQLK